MHRIFRRAVVALSAVALLGATVTACSPKENTAEGNSKVTLVYWNQTTDGPTTKAEDAIIADFEASHPDITIKQTRYDSQAQLIPLSKNAFRSQATPDLIYSEVSTGRDLFNAGLAQNLNDYSKKYGWDKRITPSGLAWTTTPNKDLYGLGLETELSGVLWNKSELSELGLTVPKTLAELTNVCQVARSKDVIPIATGAGGGGWIWYFYLGLPIINELGVQAEKDFVAHKSGKWTDPEIKTAVETVFGAAKDANCFIPQMNSLEGTTAQDLFSAGKSLALAPAFTGNLSPLYSTKAEYQFTPWVTTPTSKGQFHLEGMGSAFVMNSKGKHKDETAEFIDYMFTKEVATKYIETAGFLPPVVGIDVDQLKITPLFKAGVDTIVNHSDEVGTTVDLVSSDSFNDLIGREGQAVFSGQISIDKYLEDLEAAWVKDKP